MKVRLMEGIQRLIGNNHRYVVQEGAGIYHPFFFLFHRWLLLSFSIRLIITIIFFSLIIGLLFWLGIQPDYLQRQQLKQLIEQQQSHQLAMVQMIKLNDELWGKNGGEYQEVKLGVIKRRQPLAEIKIQEHITEEQNYISTKIQMIVARKKLNLIKLRWGKCQPAPLERPFCDFNLQVNGNYSSLYSFVSELAATSNLMILDVRLDQYNSDMISLNGTLRLLLPKLIPESQRRDETSSISGQSLVETVTKQLFTYRQFQQHIDKLNKQFEERDNRVLIVNPFDYPPNISSSLVKPALTSLESAIKPKVLPPQEIKRDCQSSVLSALDETWQYRGRITVDNQHYIYLVSNNKDGIWLTLNDYLMGSEWKLVEISKDKVIFQRDPPCYSQESIIFQGQNFLHRQRQAFHGFIQQNVIHQNRNRSLV